MKQILGRIPINMSSDAYTLERNVAAKITKNGQGQPIILGKKEPAPKLSIRVRRFVAHFCQMCTDNFYFWVAVAMFALFEPLLCSRYPTENALKLQYAVLAGSTVLFFIQLIGVASREWETIHAMQLQFSDGLFPITSIGDMSALKLLIFLVNEEEYLFESICLTLGWVCIFPYPGIAALRCFRVYRLLWFYEVKVFRSATIRSLNPILGKNFVKRVFNVLKFAIKAITALIDEMLRVGHRTRGGIILICMLFYTAYVMGIVLWVETRGNNENCVDIGTCIFTLMRLTFFDGSGFDFAFFLTESHKGLFVIVMFYMVLTSFGILNGLVGIFGNVFANASEEAFGKKAEDELDDDDDDEEQEKQPENRQPDSLKPAADSDRDLYAAERPEGDAHEADGIGAGGNVSAGNGGSKWTSAKRLLRKESMEADSVDGDQVLPFSSDRSIGYFPSSNASAPSAHAQPPTGAKGFDILRKVVPGVADSPSRDSPSPNTTLKPGPGDPDRKLTYSQLMQLLETRKAVKRHPGLSGNVPGSFQTSNDRSPPKMRVTANIMTMFGSAKSRSAKVGGGGGGANAAFIPGAEQELRLLREDMRAMLFMQGQLQAQLNALLGGEVQVSSTGSVQVKPTALRVPQPKADESMRPYTP